MSKLQGQQSTPAVACKALASPQAPADRQDADVRGSRNQRQNGAERFDDAGKVAEPHVRTGFVRELLQSEDEKENRHSAAQNPVAERIAIVDFAQQVQIGHRTSALATLTTRSSTAVHANQSPN